MYQILSVTEMHTVWMTCYTDKYQFLCRTIIQFQCPITPNNIHYCTVPLSSSNDLLHRSISNTVPYHYPIPMPCYTDQYPLLYRTIIQFQWLLTPISIHYCTVSLSSSNALLRRSISITVPYHNPDPMPFYTDQYPLLCRTIIKFQSPVFRTCKFLKFNVPSCAIQTKQPYFYKRIDAKRFDSYTEHVLMTALLDMIDT
jgi:hypothetical protein